MYVYNYNCFNGFYQCCVDDDGGLVYCKWKLYPRAWLSRSLNYCFTRRAIRSICGCGILTVWFAHTYTKFEYILAANTDYFWCFVSRCSFFVRIGFMRRIHIALLFCCDCTKINCMRATIGARVQTVLAHKIVTFK